MNVEILYKGFSKIVDNLNKFKTDKFNFSKGVFTSYNEGIMTIVTFTEKLENNIKDLFPFVFDISPSIFKFMDKHFEIDDISISNSKIQFIYTCANTAEMYKDKAFQKVQPYIYKNDEFYCVDIDIDKSDLYRKSLDILNSIVDIDFNNSKEVNIDIYNDINNSEIPIIIQDDEFYVRLSKSTFQNVTKGDTAIVRCIPYKDKNSSVFLTTTTVNKSEYQIINVFNVLYLFERDE